MPRDPDVLRRQVGDLTAYFEGVPDLGELAYSLAPHGSTIQMGGHQGRRAARYTVAIERLVDAVPLHLRLYARTALRQLPLEERLPIELVVVAGCFEADVADALGCSARTVRRRIQRGLEQCARWLWTDAGEQRLPPGVRRG